MNNLRWTDWILPAGFLVIVFVLAVFLSGALDKETEECAKKGGVLVRGSHGYTCIQAAVAK